jgi:hypothetical protein
LSIDETLVLFKGRWKYRQHIKSKPHATGLKYFVLATTSNYIFDFWLYMGTESRRNTDVVSIVCDFVDKLEGFTLLDYC